MLPRELPLLRHDVFHVAASLRDADASLGETGLRVVVDYAADRIADESKIRRSKQFPYQTVQACERASNTNIGGFHVDVFIDAVFNVIRVLLADNNQRFVAEVEEIEL